MTASTLNRGRCFSHAAYGGSRFVTEADADGHVLTVRQQLVWSLIDADPSLASGAACVALTGDAEGLEQLFEALCSEINAERAGRAAALDSLTKLIMIRLLRLCAHAQPARPTAHEDLRIFHRFNELIEAHYLEHWPLARYAESIGVTQARLNEVCRRIADLPSKRLILERLMQEAKRLLLFTGSSANEICYQLGFKDPAYFSRFFLRYAQMTPGSIGYGRRGCADKGSDKNATLRNWLIVVR